ncbi:PIN2/TERF1-interacting telomerase inhibitor 1 isoform X2 [Drosophila grimshawi]|uniref:PIN2/TERF1-interacting telomerase inhibitor 1 isoform X2 n=1 Tax=Drosophila grimshawi TaxID=7222 RepID=UPI000C86F268|nr:PIN2/TERF1-interacting telomerase inhibitor 1 isoform X2 [Drosophila grimshawi]
MAMLAEPRRRKRYNLCPRGKALYEDDTRFGTKMLEKMGWSKGRGLGAKEDGSQEFVRVRFKNDAEGLGYEMRDDQWTEHEEGFNGLLKALNGGDTNGEIANPENDDASASEEERRPMGFGFKSAAADEEVKPKTLKEKISGVSLEEKSKYSKARVHYKKFTRGKDLSQYSEKDLANIFGKKVSEDNAASVEVIPAEQPEEEEKPVNPNFSGVQTVITGLSVNDYFKQKMEAMKNRLSNGSASKVTETSPLLNEAEDKTEAVTASGSKDDEPPKKKKKKKDKKQEEEQAESELPVETVTRKAKNKKTKRAADEDEAELEKGTIETDENNPPKRKKKKKDRQEKAEVLIATPDPTNAEPKKKKKSKKIEETIPETTAETESPKKKNKKSRTGDKEEPTIQPEVREETAPKTKKKSKKTVEQSLNDVEDLAQEDQPTAKGEQSDQLIAKEKKKKKSKEHKSEKNSTY